MNRGLLSGFSLFLLVNMIGCRTPGKLEFISPTSGHRALYGETLKITLSFPDTALDSVVYAMDGNIIERRQDTASVTVDTKLFGLGDRSLTAKVYIGGKEDIAYSKVMILPESAKNYGFELVHSYPHATDAFTQGLQFADGVLYESTGNPSGTNLRSSLRKVDLTSGRVLKKVELDEAYFGEGMTIVDDKIVFLTWQSNVGFFYDKETFRQLGSFQYGNSREGWGLTYDGQRLIKSDGSNRLYFLDAKTGEERDVISVYDENGAVDQLNELEYIDGKVYANVYQKDIIVIINPTSGAVEGRINLVGLYTENRQPYDNELNGIAYDTGGKRLFVTGKLWSKLFEIKMVAR